MELVFSARRRLNRARAYAGGLLVALGLLALLTKNGVFILLIIVNLMAYAAWRMGFSCPRCGTSYLWEMNGILLLPRLLGQKCRKCGSPTDQDYSGPFEPME